MLYSGANGDLLPEDLCHTHTPPKLLMPVPLVPDAGHCWLMPPQETLKQSQANLAQSLVGVTAPSLGPGAYLVGMRFDFKYDYTSPIVILWLLLCPWTQGYLFLVGSNILLSMVVQQLVAILVFLQETMSTHPSTPSCFNPNLSALPEEKDEHKGPLLLQKIYRLLGWGYRSNTIFNKFHSSLCSISNT